MVDIVNKLRQNNDCKFFAELCGLSIFEATTVSVVEIAFMR